MQWGVSLWLCLDIDLCTCFQKHLTHISVALHRGGMKGSEVIHPHRLRICPNRSSEQIERSALK